MTVDVEQETVEAVVDEASSKKALDLIQEQCVLMAVHAPCWQGRHKIGDDAEIHIDGHKIADDVVGEPYWDLIPKKWRSRLTRHGPKARRKVRDRSIPFVIKGLYFVPIDKADVSIEEVEQVRGELDEDVRAFVSAYPSIIEELKAKMKEDFERVKNKLKKQNQLYDLFSIEVIPIRVSLVNFIGGRASAYVRQAKAAMTQTVNTLIENMIAEPRQQMYEALQRLREALNDPDRNVQQRSLDALVKRFEKLKSFAFMADDRVINAMQAVEREIRATTPRVLNFKGDANETLSYLLQQAEKECETDATERRAVKRVRQRVVSV